MSHKIKQTKKMKSLKDKVKDFIMYLFDSVKQNKIISKDYLIAELTPDAMVVLQSISDIW